MANALREIADECQRLRERLRDTYCRTTDVAAVGEQVIALAALVERLTVELRETRVAAAHERSLAAHGIEWERE